MFTKSRERLTEHDAVIAFFNEVVTMAEEKSWPSGERFSVDGTLIDAWASHKSFVRKADDDNGNSDSGMLKGQARSNEIHESKTDPDPRLYRKGKIASELRFMGQTLRENRHGLIASTMVTVVDGHAEREAAKAMIHDACQFVGGDGEITMGTDRGYDAREFIDAL